MNNSPQTFAYSLPALPRATHDDCNLAKKMLHARAGIVLGAHKEDMIARSLGLRARELNLSTVKEYLESLKLNPRAEEWSEFVNIFTINHTAFYRERHHFDVLANFVKKRSKPISVWSSATSTGEEAYTIALTLSEALPNSGSQVSILASDIDTAVVNHAKKGVYPLERIQPVPDPLLKKYFQRGRGQYEGKVRVKSILRDVVDFQVINLTSDENWPSQHQFDAIFCRNTMIYFEQQTQIQLLDKFAQLMKPGALLFVGHSENISPLSSAFKLKGQTVYVRV